MNPKNDRKIPAEGSPTTSSHTHDMSGASSWSNAPVCAKGSTTRGGNNGACGRTHSKSMILLASPRKNPRRLHNETSTPRRVRLLVSQVITETTSRSGTLHQRGLQRRTYPKQPYSARPQCERRRTLVKLKKDSAVQHQRIGAVTVHRQFKPGRMKTIKRRSFV